MIGLIAIATCAVAPGDIEPTRWTPAAAQLATTVDMWAAQYHAAEKCSGKKGDAARIRFYVVPGKDFRCPTGRCIGWTSITTHSIYIAAEWITTAWVFRHEALHEITGWGHDTGDDGTPGPRDVALWGKACHASWGFLEGSPGYRP